MKRILAPLIATLLLLGQLALGPAPVHAGWLSSSSATSTSGPTDSMEESLREAELPWRDLLELAVRTKALPPESLNPKPVIAPPPRPLGHQTSYWVADMANDSYYAVSATLKVVTPHIYMYVADDSRVDLGRLEEAARFFEERIYQKNRGYFGTEKEAGLKGETRLTILNATIPGLGGYFTSVDDYPRVIQQYSNEAKILYINIDAAPPGSSNYYSILAHEFEHMVHWNTNRVEQSWVKEGAAEVATEAAELGTSGAMRAFESKPDTQLNSWADTKGNVAPHYGASYLFISYFLERFGGYEFADDLLTGDTRGEETFDRFLSTSGQSKSFEDLFKDWVVANYLDEAATGDPRYRYEKLSLRVPTTERITSSTGWRDRTVNQFGTDYVELAGRWSKARIRFQGDQVTRIIPAQAHSGQSFWWSNRADLVNTRLTRILDLRDVESATLKFWGWHDLEVGYDYAYVTASRDGGLTWQTLPSTHTTTENPNGNNLGHGFTGRSGGGEQARWQEESVDLTPFAGDIAMVRFEMVTDDAYNAPGFAVDDISIPELDYQTDAENEDGWIPEGFVWGDGELSQRFSLQLIRFGPEITVEQLPITGRPNPEILVDNSDGRLERAVLVVSGLTRHTTEPAHYRYSVEMTP